MSQTINQEAGRTANQRRAGHLPSPAALALLLYLLLTLALAYPLILHFGTHVPGSETWAFDEYTFVYNQWWFKYAVLDLGVNPLYSDHIWAPVGINLVLYTYTLFNAALSLPLQPFFNLALTSNLIMVLSTALSGLGTFLLIRYLLRDRLQSSRLSPRGLWWAAFVGGALYAFAGNRFIYLALGHYDMVSTEWLPLFTLFLLKTLRERKWTNPVLAGLFATFAMLCEMIYGVFLAILTIILILFEPAAPGESGSKQAAWSSRAARLTLLGGTAGITYAPVLIAISKEMRQGYILSGWGDALKLSADLLSFITPTALNPLFGKDWTAELAAVRQGTAQFADVNTVLIGWAALLVALIACITRWKTVRAWAVAASTFGLLSLGPLLQISGRHMFDLDGLQTSIPLPFIILHYLPIAKGNRAPNRNVVILMLAVAVLVGFGIAWLLEHRSLRKRQRWAAPALSIILAGVLLVEHLSVPLPLTDARVPEYYQRLAEESGDFAILTLPLGWRDSFGVLGAEDTRVQYYQTTHKKRLIGGNSGRHPAFNKEYYDAIPFFHALTEIELYREVDDATLRIATEQAPNIAYLYDIRYVVVHPPIPGRPPYADTWSDAEQFVLTAMPLDPIPIYDDEGLRVYQVNQPPAEDGFRVDPGAPGWGIYRGEGWDRNEEIGGQPAVWATDKMALVFVPLREVKERELILSVLPFEYPGCSPQAMEVRLNGNSLGEPRALTAGWTEYRWEAPAALQKEGLNEVTLHFAWTASPRDVLPGNREIGSTGTDVPQDIEVNSAGLDAGDFAYITIGTNARDAEDGSTHRRGYNLAVLDPETGEITGRAAFDTAANEYEAQAMAEFLSDLPDGVIVIAAMRGDGARYLTDKAVDGLHAIGSAIDPRQDPSRSHALVGIKGSVRGSASEVWEVGQSWLRVGGNPDSRSLAAAVGSVQLK